MDLLTSWLNLMTWFWTMYKKIKNVIRDDSEDHSSWSNFEMIEWEFSDHKNVVEKRIKTTLPTLFEQSAARVRDELVKNMFTKKKSIAYPEKFYRIFDGLVDGLELPVNIKKYLQTLPFMDERYNHKDGLIHDLVIYLQGSGSDIVPETNFETIFLQKDYFQLKDTLPNFEEEFKACVIYTNRPLLRIWPGYEYFMNETGDLLIEQRMKKYFSNFFPEKIIQRMNRGGRFKLTPEYKVIYFEERR